MSFVEIKKDIIKKGLLEGTPCMFVNLNATQGEEATNDYIFSEVLKSKIKNVLIAGSLKEFTFIKELALGFSSKGKIINYSFKGDEDISPLRSIRNLRFILNCTPPTDTQNTVHLPNLPLLKEDDELCMIIKTKEDYDNAKSFLLSKTITRPLIVFVGIIQDDKEKEEVLSSYLNDVEVFFFKNRIQFLI